MKKILISLFLILILTSCSQNKKESALENCADYKLRVKYSQSYTEDGFSDLGYIMSFIKKQKEAENLLDSSYKAEESLSMWINSVRSKQAEPSKYFVNQWADNRANIKQMRIRAYEIYKMHSGNLLSETSLKKKIKNPVYPDFLTLCEKEFNETPTSFLLEWKD
jgi:hypothetical protein